MEFKGDIIITDPCYIFSEIWDKIDCFEGSDIKDYGITNYLWEDTLYGDWSCHTFKIHDKDINNDFEKILRDSVRTKDTVLGQFCADAGLVGVFYLDEVLKVNSGFDYHLTKEWTTTLIPNFKGNVESIIYNESLHLLGKGNINFFTTQTGF